MKQMLTRQIANILRNNLGKRNIPCIFDQGIRVSGIAEELLSFVLEDIEHGKIPKEVTVMCSGKFGELVKETFVGFTVICVQGGLSRRDFTGLPDLTGYQLSDCIFVDDAIYSCRTQTRVQRAVEKQGGRVVKAYYAYCSGGSPFMPRMRSITTYNDVMEEMKHEL